MREIKFRGITINGEIVIGNLAIIAKEIKALNCIEAGSYISNSLGSPFAYKVIPETVGEFTGLKDKNGKEIFEGDILNHHGIIAWNDVEHRWSAIDLNWNDKREWHDIDYLTSPFEIIGNIHENKELLK